MAENEDVTDPLAPASFLTRDQLVRRLWRSVLTVAELLHITHDEAVALLQVVGASEWGSDPALTRRVSVVHRTTAFAGTCASHSTCTSLCTLLRTCPGC